MVKMVQMDEATGALSLAVIPATGVVETTAVYTSGLTTGDLIYLYDAGAGVITAAKADANSSPAHPAVGYALETYDTGTHRIGLSGIIAGILTGAVVDAEYFLSDTAGQAAATPSVTTIQNVGYAVSLTDLAFTAGIPVAG